MFKQQKFCLVVFTNLFSSFPQKIAYIFIFPLYKPKHMGYNIIIKIEEEQR